jgi:hypothetical protein
MHGKETYAMDKEAAGVGERASRGQAGMIIVLRIT